MIEMRRVLCPTDLSEISAHALSYAAAFAGWYGARLTVLHVVPPLPVMLGTAGALMPPPADYPEKHRPDLDRFLADHAPPGSRPVEALLDAGRPAERIAARAEEKHADLLVVGTHGRRGLPRWLLGSVVEELLRTAPCPVLAVPPRADDAPPPVPLLLERLLCALDFSDASLRAAELSLSLAQEADASLTLLHVVGALPVVNPFAPVDLTLARQARDLAAEAEQRLREAVPQGARDWCRPDVVVVTGKPWREIVREAAGRGSGLIVMGVHGHGPLDRFFFGSTAAAVLRHAGCPVLVARARAALPEPATA
jgi:nucleotide-binding universal stress UspA family protein